MSKNPDMGHPALCGSAGKQIPCGNDRKKSKDKSKKCYGRTPYLLVELCTVVGVRMGAATPMISVTKPMALGEDEVLMPVIQTFPEGSMPMPVGRNGALLIVLLARYPIDPFAVESSVPVGLKTVRLPGVDVFAEVELETKARPRPSIMTAAGELAAADVRVPVWVPALLYLATELLCKT